MNYYVHTYRDSDGEMMVSDPYSGNKPNTSSWVLKAYQVNDDGTLTEYVEPERMFAIREEDGSLGKPYPERTWMFSDGNAYYEVMPNGDYRKLSRGEMSDLRVQRQS